MRALYFPHLSLPDAGWVNPAILFFETIQIIAPMVSRRAFYDRRTAELIDERIVKPTTPGMRRWDGAADLRFLGALNDLPANRRRRTQPARVHVGKLAYTDLGAGLRESGLFREIEDGWLLTQAWAADEVLTYLALQMTSQASGPAALVTDNGPAWTMATGLPVQERRMGREFRAAAALLPVAPDAPVRKLLDFRRRHGEALRAFREEVAWLAAIRANETAGDYDLTARIIEAQKIREELIRDLKGFDLFAAGRRIVLSGLPLVAALAEGSVGTAGACYLALASTVWREGQRIGNALGARSDPLIYAALAHQRFM